MRLSSGTKTTGTPKSAKADVGAKITPPTLSGAKLTGSPKTAKGTIGSPLNLPKKATGGKIPIQGQPKTA